LLAAVAAVGTVLHHRHQQAHLAQRERHHQETQERWRQEGSTAPPAQRSA
jgi:hypothetical protein